MLNKTSRSFAAVIQALGPELRDAVCIFYLTLRALDTVEDDTAFDKDKKVPLLNDFHKKLYERGWNFSGCGTGDELVLISNLHRMINVFLSLKPGFQVIIADITMKMGKGMGEFILREVDTLEDWDLYCHYVAGLVGFGLSRLFAESGLEDPSYAHKERMSNSMGLFLQKINIIRDYLEDIDMDRRFWPRQVWSKYANKFEDFKKPENATNAVYCLNDLITNAMEHLPDCVDYLAGLRDRNVFNFCAIPQIMAMGTYAACYENPNVFTGVVKISREDTMEIIRSMNGMQTIYVWYTKFINQILAKINPKDPNGEKLRHLLTNAKKLIESQSKISKL